MPEAGLRLALFDCDGTLIDSQHTIIASMAAAFAAIGLAAPAAEQVRRVVGLKLDLAIAELAAGLAAGLEMDAVDSAVDAYLAAFQALHSDPAHQEPLYDGMLGTLDALEADGWLLGIATGKSHRGLISTLDRHGLRPRFATLQTADQAASKPSPEMVLRALAETGVALARVVVIGDTGFDIGMAANAGVRSIGVGWGYHPLGELSAAGATRTASACADLPALLNALVPPLVPGPAPTRVPK